MTRCPAVRSLGTGSTAVGPQARSFAHDWDNIVTRFADVATRSAQLAVFRRMPVSVHSNYLPGVHRGGL